MNKLYIVVAVLVVLIAGAYWSMVASAPTTTPTDIPRMGATYPDPTNYVVDTTGTLSQSIVDSLNSDLKNFDPTAQIAVVFVNSTSPESLEDYSIHLADKWKVGYKGIDNGVILLVAKADHKIRIEVGRGVEDKLTDAESGRIINNVIAPKFKQGDFDGGTVDGVAAIKAELK